MFVFLMKMRAIFDRCFGSIVVVVAVAVVVLVSRATDFAESIVVVAGLIDERGLKIIFILGKQPMKVVIAGIDVVMH